jgi:hypothetical protein
MGKAEAGAGVEAEAEVEAGAGAEAAAGAGAGRLIERPPAADGSNEDAETGDASGAGWPSPALRPDYSLHV